MLSDPLRSRVYELRDLQGVIALAMWDQETYLPKKAEASRAEQLGTLQSLYHERLVDPRLGEWLEAPKVDDGEAARVVELLRRERRRAVRVPPALVRALAEAQARGLAAWREARAQRTFEPFREALATLVRLRQEQADAWGPPGGGAAAATSALPHERYDALLESYEPGMRVARLWPVLESLRRRLAPIVAAIEAAPQRREVFDGKRFDVEAQWRFGLEVLQAMGFDLDAGRQDRSVHPFAQPLHPTDVRLTTRLRQDQPLSALYGTMHEGGHGLYEQGFEPRHFRTPLAQAPSTGLHESQSRLWENLVGRSRAFWTHFYPRLQMHFPSELAEVALDDFVRAAARVERSTIRVEADEVTYNLHIVLRAELELELVRGSLPVAELEAAWNDKTKALLGLTVATPLEGVLQDIHWAMGEFGYFPTYAIGNLYAAALYRSAREALGDLDALVAKGELWPLREWLRSEVHAHGFLLDAEVLVQRVTGQGLTDEPFISGLREKYADLYGIEL